LPAETVRRCLAGAAVLAFAFGVLTAFVTAGKLQWLDVYAVRHWMPDFTPVQSGAFDTTGLWRPFPLDVAAWQQALDLWTYPGSFLVSGLATAVACVVLWRRGDTVAAGVWVAVWLLANAIEYAGKSGLDRPPIEWHGHGLAIPTFRNSYPSGHTIRSLVVVALVIFLARRYAVPAIVWVVLVPPFLVISGNHTPSDVVGGAFVGLALVLLAAAALALRRVRAEKPR